MARQDRGNRCDKDKIMPDYGAILSRSLELIKKNKWLFVWGMILAAFASGGSYSQSGNYTNPSSFESLPEGIPENLPEKTSLVLGTYTTAITEWFQTVSPFTWVLLFFVVVAAVLFGWLVKLIITSWAKGGLIYGFEKGMKNEEATLRNTSPLGVKSIKNLIVLSIIMFFIFIGLFLVVPGIWVLIYLVFSQIEVLATLWVVVGVLGGVVLFFGSLIILSMITVYAERLIVLKGMAPWEAWKKALTISKGSFLPTLVMGIINMVLGFGLGCISIVIALVILGIPGYLLVFPNIMAKNWPSPAVWISLAILLLIFILVSVLMKAFIIMFKYANWNQMFEHALNKTEGGQNE